MTANPNTHANENEGMSLDRRDFLKAGSATAVAIGCVHLQKQLIQTAKAQTNEPRLQLGSDYVVDDSPDGNGDLVIEHLPSGAELRYDQSTDTWLTGNFTPKILGDRGYIEHPDYNTLSDVLAENQVAMVGSGDYGNLTVTSDNKTVMGIGASSDLGNVDASTVSNFTVFFCRFNSHNLDLFETSICLTNIFGLHILTIHGDSNSVTGNPMVGGDVTIDGNNNSVTNNPGAVLSVDYTINGNNNVVTGNTLTGTITDNGTGNVVGNNT